MNRRTQRTQSPSDQQESSRASGKPVAVLLAPTDEDDLDRLMLARSPRFQALLAKSRRSIAAGNKVGARPATGISR